MIGAIGEASEEPVQVARHEKSSKPSANVLFGYLKFPQIESFKFPQRPIICDQKQLFLPFKGLLASYR